MFTFVDQEAMRAELSRRMLMDASERQLPPFLRPESMMFPPGAAGAASMGSNPLASNMPGSAMLLQQMVCVCCLLRCMLRYSVELSSLP